jgi:hypothetical protein
MIIMEKSQNPTGLDESIPTSIFWTTYRLGTFIFIARYSIDVTVLTNTSRIIRGNIY